MSFRLIDLNDDLRRLREKGFNIDVQQEAYLVVRDIPYVNAEREVRPDGILITELTLSGDETIKPKRHQMWFVGECPCDRDGTRIDAIRPNPVKRRLSEKLEVDFEFSNKPRSGGYADHYEKVTNYASLISGPASSIDPSVSPMSFAVVEPEEGESVFRYLDTASAAAGISIIAKKLAVERVAIVGLGGTGSYVLDLLAKTPVKEIHLYDGDKLSSHNAFRAPGAPSLEGLREQPAKVDYFVGIYDRMHSGIVAHPEYIDETNATQLVEMSYVFLCMDSGPGKRAIVDALEETEVPFIDVGIGVYEKDETLGGGLQVTTSTPANRDQARARMSLSDADEPNEYDRNIQTADLNALNATLAVMRWKKLRGFYFDAKKANFQSFTIGGSLLLNEDGQGS